MSTVSLLAQKLSEEIAANPQTGWTTTEAAIELLVEAIDAAVMGGGGQPTNANLTAISLLTTTAYGLNLLTLANQAALVALIPEYQPVGSYQPLDSDLTAIAALTTTTFGRSLLTMANIAALRNLLVLGSADAVTFGSVTTTGVLSIGSSASFSSTVAVVGTISSGGSVNGALPTEMSRLSGVTSSIQNQLDAKQPLDSDLTAIAALTTTSIGRSLLAGANAAAIRSILGIAPTVDTVTFYRVNVTDAFEVTANTVLNGTLSVFSETYFNDVVSFYAGVIGDDSGGAVGAGIVGEIITDTTSPAGLANGITASATLVALTPGEWEISVVGTFTLTGATTTRFVVACGPTINSLTGALKTDLPISLTTSSAPISFSAPTFRVNTTDPISYYATFLANFSVGSINITTTITARRIR